MADEKKGPTYFPESVFRAPEKPEARWGPDRVDIPKVEAWLEFKWKGSLACPVCNDKSWFISDRFISLPTAPSTLQVQQYAYPSIQLICTICGYVMLFNWGIILHGGSPRG